MRPLTVLVIIFCVLEAIGCATHQPGQNKDQPPPYTHAEVNVTIDPQGRPASLARRIDDPAEVKRLMSFFPGAGSGKFSLVAGGWKARVTVRFVRPNGYVVEVFSDYEDWSEGDARGDFPVRGDLAAYVHELAGLP